MRILIITKFFSPERSIAAVRWTKIAKYLKKNHGYEIDVLTETRNFDVDDGLPIKIPKDTLLEKDLTWIDNNLEVPLGLVLKLLFSLRNKAHERENYTESLVYLQEDKNGVKSIIKKAVINLIHYCVDDLWAKQAIRYLKKKDLGKWDVVISSCSPFWVHRAAESIKQKNRDVFWIADFRDPYPSGLNNKLFFELEKRKLNKYSKTADIVLRINDDMRMYFDSMIQMTTVTNGFDPDEIREPQKPPLFNILYTGSLYYYSYVSPVFKAINELTSKGLITEGDIKVDFYGSRECFITDQVKEYQAEGYYTHHGLVSRDEIIVQQQKAGILLQMEKNDNDFKAGWSGKMYEYMMSRKPIVFIVSGAIPHSIPSQYIDKLGGYCYEQSRDSETYQGLKEYIYLKYCEWKDTGNVTVRRDESFVYQYSYPSIANSISNIIERCS